MSRSANVRGLIPVLATPFHPNGALDTASLRRLVEFQLAAEVDGVAVFGFASEGFTLTAAERHEILRVITEAAGPGLPIVAGVAATGTQEAIEQARAAADGGAGAVMVVPPYMVKPNPSQVVDFYGTVAERGEVPVMVQDAPASTGVNMPVSLIVELSKLDGCTSVKIETQPTAPKVGAVVDATAVDFLTLGGQNALFALEEYGRGAVGTMPACEFPDLLRPALAHWENGDPQAAHEQFTRVLPLIRFGLQPGIAWSIHKHVLLRRGIIASATVRSPAQDADAGTLRDLEFLMSTIGWLS